MPTIDVQLTEEERQAVLLALGQLAYERPGWDQFLAGIATKLHGEELFERFKQLAHEERP